VEIKEIEPASITVTLDPAVHKTVPVVVKINGKVGEGLAPDEPQVEPENVEVRGAKSDVDTILEATAEVTLRGDTQDVKKAVTLKGLNAKGEEINDLQFSPNQVSVTIPIIKAGKTKTVGIKVKTEGVPKTGYWVSQTSIEPSMINISGNGEVLANTKFIETQPINVEGIDKNKTYKNGIKYSRWHCTHRYCRRDYCKCHTCFNRYNKRNHRKNCSSWPGTLLANF
jgi:YbbR domain-containing protein